MESCLKELPYVGARAPRRIVREPYLAERVIFVGGQPGCGKTLMMALLGTLDRVEIQLYDYPLEYICALSDLGAVSDEVATTMIRMLSDLDLYNMTMSRCVNFRFADYTSVFRNPGKWRYLRRLIQPGDAAAVTRIRQTHPILQLTVHNLLALCGPLFRALEGRLRILEVVRHPLYMIKQWYLYIDAYGNDPRDFNIWYDYEGKALPYFAKGWEEQYVRSNKMDRVIYSIAHIAAQGEAVLAGLSEQQRSRIMILPFERFVLDPWPSLRTLEALLDTQVTRRTRREMKRQRVPRRRIADGLPLKAYKLYGWEPAMKESDERRELEKRWRYTAAEASPEGMRVLDELCARYEVEHLSGMPGW